MIHLIGILLSRQIDIRCRCCLLHVSVALAKSLLNRSLTLTYHSRGIVLDSRGMLLTRVERLVPQLLFDHLIGRGASIGGKRYLMNVVLASVGLTLPSMEASVGPRSAFKAPKKLLALHCDLLLTNWTHEYRWAVCLPRRLPWERYWNDGRSSKVLGHLIVVLTRRKYPGLLLPIRRALCLMIKTWVATSSPAFSLASEGLPLDGARQLPTLLWLFQ